VKHFFCSWSGGKDSCLSLYKAILNGDHPKFLITTCVEDEARSHSHGLSLDVLDAQAQSLNIELITIATSWENYENNFVKTIKKIKMMDDKIQYGAFGDIDIEAHAQWEKNVCAAAGIKAYLPLWRRDRKEILQEFLQHGFKAMIIAVNTAKVNVKYLGQIIDEKLIEEFSSIGIDPCGENGEYHSVVVSGPIFKGSLMLAKSAIVFRDNYAFLDVAITR
jgi:diphthine-ammonia ligase